MLRGSKANSRSEARRGQVKARWMQAFVCHFGAAGEEPDGASPLQDG